ncbi:MAG TPA: RHS repeat-associated core domain-containing protein [Pyrinomonadaceae bacterium]|jgi:RHS repeat-associated protein
MSTPQIQTADRRSLRSPANSTGRLASPESISTTKTTTAPEFTSGNEALPQAGIKHLVRKRVPSMMGVIVWIVSLACLCCAVTELARAQSNNATSLNLNDTGSQIGRNNTGDVNAPAAFNGMDRPDTASFRISERLLSLPGRGLGVNLDLNYDSSIYQLSKTADNAFYVQSTPKDSRPAHGFHLGYGKLIVQNATSQCRTTTIGIGFCNEDFQYPNFTSSALFIDSTGARHQIERGISVDSSDLRYYEDANSPSITYPDGTKIIFGASYSQYSHSWYGQVWSGSGGATCRKVCDLYTKTFFPKKIVDRNGNYIQIFYTDGAGNDVGPTLSYIKDTLGREIKFNWVNGNLTTITVPGLMPNSEREVVRFYTESMTRVHSFTTNSGSENIKIISYIYMPGTKSGWHYYYSSYGMIYRVEKLLGMEVDPNTGAITNYGQVAASTEYNYPTTPSSLGFELPKYTTRTDDWMGNTAGPIVHQFNVNYIDAEDKSVTTITAPDGSVSEIQKYWFHAREHNPSDWTATWSEGLVKEEKLTKNSFQYSRATYSWQNTAGGPRLRQLTMTNDAGQQKITTYDYYDPPIVNNSFYNGVFSNVKVTKEFGFDGVELRRTEMVYETRAEWINRWLVKLPTKVKVFAGGATLPISQTDYTYDGDPNLTIYNGVPMLETNTPLYRGNVTTISQNTNAAAPEQGVTLISTMKYDVAGNVVSTTDAGNRTSLVDYTDSFSDGLTRNSYAYPTLITTPVPDPNGVHGANAGLTTRVVYNFNTSLAISITNANNQTVSCDYDALSNRLLKVTRPDGGWTSYTYSHAPGDLYVKVRTLQRAIPSEQILESRQYFDPLGRGIRSFSSEGNTWLVTDKKYDPVNLSVSVSNHYRVNSLSEQVNPSNWTTTTFDPLGRELITTAPDGSQVKMVYDGMSVLMTTPSGKQRISNQDALGRLTDVWEISTADATTEQVAFQGQTLTGYHASYIYDVLGNLRQINQGTQKRYFAYDSLSRLVRAKYPEEVANSNLSLASPDSVTGWNQWSQSFSYDAGGNLESKTDARSIKTIYEYDGLSRLFKRRHLYVGCGNQEGCSVLPAYYTATPTVEYFYDGTGMPFENGAPLPTPANSKELLTAVKSPNSESIYTEFDVMGRVKAYRQVTAGASQPYIMRYTYDLEGKVLTEQYPSGRVVTSEYDDAGRLAGVKQDSSYYVGGAPGTTNSIRYAPHGKISALRLGNALWENVVYDPQRLQPTQLGLGTSSTDSSKLRLDYTYSTPGLNDNDGNVRSQKITVPEIAQPLVQTYTYDQLNRLRSAQETGGTTTHWKQTFNYDLYGNRSIDIGLENNQPKTTPSLVGPNPSISPSTNRIVRRVNSSELYQYDDAGNLTMDQTGNTFSYDAENKQTSYTLPNSQTASATYFYDGSGRRVKKVVGNQTTFFVYNTAGRLVAEYSNAAPYAGGRRYITTDLLGSPRVITDQSGTVKERHDYLPYGEEIADFGGRGSVPAYGSHQLRQKFAGYERDGETQLDFAQARYYNSQAGRFNSIDPLITSARLTNPQTFNRYAYCANNPINATDPTGQDWWYDTQETGPIRHPVWFPNDSPPSGDRYKPWVGSIYWNVEDQKWWALNPWAEEQRGFDTKYEAERQLSEWGASVDAPSNVSLFDGILEMAGYISGITGAVRGGIALGAMMFARREAATLAAETAGNLIVNIGGVGEVAGAINVNILKDRVAAGIPNLIKASGSEIGNLFKAGSVSKIISNRLPFSGVAESGGWTNLASGAYRVLAPGGRVTMNVTTSSAAEVAALQTAFKSAGFASVKVEGSGFATIVNAIR